MWRFYLHFRNLWLYLYSRSAVSFIMLDGECRGSSPVGLFWVKEVWEMCRISQTSYLAISRFSSWRSLSTSGFFSTSIAYCLLLSLT